ncbi:MAG: FHA domain-containing protein [Acidobacteriia bacterium]|nr:FHA domain-containing protein [Terriglobia bacterium]
MGQTWAIGRGEGCGILLDSRAVSRLHALVQRHQEGEYYLVDLGSRNGSFLNGQRVSLPVPLRDRDRLVFAEQELVFRNPTEIRDRGTDPRASGRNLPTEALATQSLATIVVVDIRDFTPLTRSISEALLSQTIGTWFLRVGQAAVKWGSWAQQYIGDAVMAVWVHRNSAAATKDQDRVLRAVCEFHRCTCEISRTLPLPQPLRIGAGINTGRVILGGTDYTALGEAVNSAFRLEAATKTIGFSVILGEGAFAQWSATDSTPFHRCEVQLKGYESPSAVWAISFEDLERFVDSRGG